jgi:hypothetical protein
MIRERPLFRVLFRVVFELFHAILTAKRVLFVLVVDFERAIFGINRHAAHWILLFFIHMSPFLMLSLFQYNNYTI